MKPFALGDKRIFYYTENPSFVRNQIEGKPFDYRGEALVFGVSTDTIINGAACTLGYTEQILGPHFLVGKGDVIHEGDLVNGNFAVIAGGESYGSGSHVKLRSWPIAAPVSGLSLPRVWSAYSVKT